MQPSLFEPVRKFAPLILRPYQREAIDAVYAYLRTHDDNPCVVVPTGGGKTPILATICRDAVKTWQGRVLVLAHVKELLQQTCDKLAAVCPDVSVGVYSAGLDRRETRQSVIVAGIQSVYQRACELDRFDLVIVDEAHLIPPDGDGMYRQFLADAKVVNPALRIVGLTATPYRLRSGMICTPDGFLNQVCYEVGVRQLIVDGYLSPLVSKAGKTKAHFEKIHVRGGEFVADEMAAVMDDDVLVASACREIAEQTADRKAVLIFTSGVEHGRHVVAELATLGLTCGFIDGETPDRERAATLAAFLSGELKYLANVNVLTTGFDAPHVDCVALLRPTMSPGLYYQMVGRGFRLHPGKRDCLILDFGGNVLRHGPVDAIQVAESKRSARGGDAPAKECPKCQAVIATGYARCPACGFEFPPPERQRHDATATDAGVLSGQIKDEVFTVRNVLYSVHRKRGGDDDAPRSLRVDYGVGLNRWVSEWVCVEHVGFARQKAVAWWAARSRDPVPATADDAVDLASAGSLAKPLEITVRTVSGERFERVIDYKLSPIPEPVGESSAATSPQSTDDIPF
jgi:DNA repair protein RadD